MPTRRFIGRGQGRRTRLRTTTALLLISMLVAALTVPGSSVGASTPLAVAAAPPVSANVSSLVELANLIDGSASGISFDARSGSLEVVRHSATGSHVVELTPWGDLVGPTRLTETDTVEALAHVGDGQIRIGRDGTITGEAVGSERSTDLTGVIDATASADGTVLVLHDDGATVTSLDGDGTATEAGDLGAGAAYDAIARDAATGHTYLLDGASHTLSVRDDDLDEVGQVDLAGLVSDNVAAMTIGATADNTDDPAATGLYVLEQPTGPSSLQIVQLLLSAPQAQVLMAGPPVALTLTHTRDLSALTPPSPDSAGIVYLPDEDRLLVSDSEVNEMPLYVGINLYKIPLAGSPLVGFGDTTGYSDEPTGLSFDEATETLFVSDDDDDEIYMIIDGGDGFYGTADDTIDSFDTKDFGSNDPEGAAFDPNSGALFIIDGVNKEVYRVQPNTNGFDGMPVAGGDDTVTQFDVEVLGATDPEGIAFDANRDLAMVLDDGAQSIFEMTPTGTHMQTLDISAAPNVNAAGVAIAPASSGAGDSLYVVDRGVDNDTDPNENDGAMYEFEYNPNPVVVPGSAFVTEGGPGTMTTISVPFNLSGPSPYTVMVDWATFDFAGGPRLATSTDNDFIANSGTLTFPPYSTTQFADVQVVGDSKVELDEWMLVRSMNHVNSQIGGLWGLGVGVILNDD